ncbi:MAG: NERD domain-containing protein [Halanaerobiales bacterium]|nr:NERD domain-containing protein [Halanaerobiales bacterium]
MAVIIPNRITPDMRATEGEVRTYNKLASQLDNNWYIWYDIGIGNSEVYPDFTLIHPQYGLFVLEVKDYKFSHIEEVTKTQVKTKFRNSKNPIIQARDYIFSVVNKVAFDPPYSYGVVFPNISREEITKPLQNKIGISDIINPKLLLTKSDLNSSLQSKLQKMRSKPSENKRLTTLQFNTLRMTIDPSIKVPHRFTSNESSDKEKIPAVLDVKQERAAKSIGEGHRLLKGIAGSGKTLIMLYRTKIIAHMHPEWDVLFICWNRSLINYLEQMYNGIDLSTSSHNIEFNYFSRWASQISKNYNINFPRNVNSPSYDKDYAEAINQLVKKSPKKQYQAILIDEAQDFEENYFRLLVNHLDKETDSLLICYDYAQNIYKKETSWKKLGIDIDGSRTIDLTVSKENLERNYRNTLEITKFAKSIYNDRIPFKDENDQISEITTIKGTADRGPVPTIQFCNDRQDEYKYIVEWIQTTKNNNNLDFSDFLIIYPGKKLKDFNLEFGLLPYFRNNDIPYHWITKDSRNKSNFSLLEDNIKISTIHSAKGMDFEAVAVIACDCINDKYNQPETQLYISSTRARKFLLMTTGGINHSIEKILDYACNETIKYKGI